MTTEPRSFRPISRRTAAGSFLVGASALLPFSRGNSLVLPRVARGAEAQVPSATPATPVASSAAAISAIAGKAMVEMDLRAVVLRVTSDGEELTHTAMGESMTGIPATPDMHLRNGAVAITYVAVVLLSLVDDGVVKLDDTISQWLPDLPDADKVTLRMLANMTAGYPDFVQNADFNTRLYADPFRAWTADELIEVSLSTPRMFAPGENWDYSHSGYVILGKALEAKTGEPLAELIKRYVLDPLNLTETASEQTAWMPEPVLHAFSSERRSALSVPADVSFLEESTFWNPSWTLPPGAVQYSTITEMATSFEAIGRGDLLSPESHKELVNQNLLGFGSRLEGCPNCHTLNNVYLYQLGIVQTGGWLMQNPLFAGFASAVGYHPETRNTIAVAATFNEGSFDSDGNYRFGNSAEGIFRQIGELLVPHDPPLIS